MAKTSVVRRNVGKPVERRTGINKQVLVLTPDMARELANDLIILSNANEKIELNIVHENGSIWLLGK
jgi:hypothetical protein